MIKIGVIGYGYWGPNLVRNFQQCDATSVTCVCDIHTSVLDRVKAAHPGVDGTVWTEELINSKDVDAVVIATPVSTHFDLALDALKAGKHVFVEKPMTQTAAQSEQLIEEAEKRNLTLMVDHTFIYTGPVRKIRELVTETSFTTTRSASTWACFSTISTCSGILLRMICPSCTMSCLTNPLPFQQRV